MQRYRAMADRLWSPAPRRGWLIGAIAAPTTAAVHLFDRGLIVVSFGTETGAAVAGFTPVLLAALLAGFLATDEAQASLAGLVAGVVAAAPALGVFAWLWAGGIHTASGPLWFTVLGTTFTGAFLLLIAVGVVVGGSAAGRTGAQLAEDPPWRGMTVPYVR